MIRIKSKADSRVRWLLPFLISFWLTFLRWATNSEFLQHNNLIHSEGKIPETLILQPLNSREAKPASPLTAKDVLPSVAIFYHIFVPKGENMQVSQNRALSIIREQIIQVGDSLATISNLTSTNLYYTTVGKPLDNGFVEDICNQYEHLRCRHLEHFDDGFEVQTLTKLYNHCQDHADDRVVYLHTKGSYNYRRSQNRVRQHVTDAVTSRDCIEQAHKEDCDLCGLLFLPRPSLHFTANMFNAQCRYIQKLLSPFDFQSSVVSLVAKGKTLLENQTLLTNMIDAKLDCNNGLGRYAMEHWHGSHPSLHKTCDVSTHSQIEYWERLQRDDRKPEDWQFHVFPRHPHTADWSYGRADKLMEIMKHESQRKREYFLLPGQLLRWYELYREFPPDSSWVWSWYPDGQFWKHQVALHGHKAVEVVAQLWD